MFQEVKKFDNELTMHIDKTQTILFSNFGHADANFDIDSSCELIFLTKDVSGNAKINVRILSPNVEVLIRTISLTKQNEHFSNIVSIIHEAKNSSCDYKFLGFAFDDSNLLIRAKNKILKGMKGSATHQSLKVITDGNARAQAEPGLMVDEFDVTASHGNSIGQIDQRTVYYLQSKGISRKQAQWMIVKGNVEDILQNVSKDISSQVILQISDIMGANNG